MPQMSPMDWTILLNTLMTMTALLTIITSSNMIYKKFSKKKKSYPRLTLYTDHPKIKW